MGKSNVFSTDLGHLENSRFETANLKHKSLIVITEGERFLDKSSMLKRIVGNDLIRFEEKYEQPAEGFYCRAIVLIAANEITQFADQSLPAAYHYSIPSPCAPRKATKFA